MNENKTIASYTFETVFREPDDMQQRLVKGEEPKYFFKSKRDICVFTNKRILISNAKGITGKTAELISIPYSSIIFYSTENAGTIADAYSILRIWLVNGEIRFQLSCEEKIKNIAKLLDDYLVR